MSLSKLHDIKKPSRYNTTTSQPRVTKGPIITSPRKSHHSSNRGKGMWYLAAVLLIGLFFGLSVFFTHATVVITPIIENISLNERFIAYKKAISQELTFDAMVVEGSVDRKITSQEKKQVEEKAKGPVRIFNDHSTESQPLRVDTRLVDEKGRIYKTTQAVVVPGKSVIDGKQLPGSIEVEIYADIAGEEFNESNELTLRLVGFKETKNPKFETIYAKTLGSIEGGFVGEKYVISEEEKQTLVDTLTQELTNNLMQKSEAQVPEQSILPKKLSVLIDTNIIETAHDDGTISFTLTGKLFNVLFNTVEFERFILQNSVVGVTQENAYIRNIKNLNIFYVDQNIQTIDPERLETLAFQIDDVLEVVSVVNKEVINFELVGQKRKDFQEIMSHHAGVQYVEHTISPFWRPRFPENSSGIEIILTTESEEYSVVDQ